MDTFIECMISKKKTAKDRLKILGVIILAIALCIVVGFLITITPKLMFLLWIFVVAIIWYGVYIVISRQNVEHEYSFTNGELDIDTIYSKRRRVHVLSVKVREFTICAPAYNERFKEQYLDVSDMKKYYYMAANMHNQKLYFADFLQNGDRVRLYFEPTDKLIEAIKFFNPRNVFLLDE